MRHASRCDFAKDCCFVAASLLAMAPGCSDKPEPAPGGPIVATFDGGGSTSYTLTVQGRNPPFHFGWEGVDCGEFSITSSERSSTYLWNHGTQVERTPQGKPPCGLHNEPGHAQAVIKATVTGGALFSCVYRGTASGRGEACENIDVPSVFIARTDY